MKPVWCKLVFVLLCGLPWAAPQVAAASAAAGAPPKVLLLVHQQFKPGKSADRQKLEVAITRGFERINAPLQWIEAEAITGPPGALFLDPVNSFEEMEQAGGALAEVFAKHPELARLQQGIDELISDSKAVITLRRDDLGYRAEAIDLSKARFLRIDVVHLHPGREGDFAQASRMASSSYQKAKASSAWVIYEVNAGTEEPAFLVITPMHSLKDADEALSTQKRVQQTDSATSGLLQQIARDTYASSESNLYSVSPTMSHVSKEFAAGDPEFWGAKAPAAGPRTPASKK